MCSLDKRSFVPEQTQIVDSKTLEHVLSIPPSPCHPNINKHRVISQFYINHIETDRSMGADVAIPPHSYTWGSKQSHMHDPTIFQNKAYRCQTRGPKALAMLYGVIIIIYLAGKVFKIRA